MAQFHTYLNLEADRPDIVRLMYGPNGQGYACSREQYAAIEETFECIMNFIGASRTSTCRASDFNCVEYSIGYSAINIGEAFEFAVANPMPDDDVFGSEIREYFMNLPELTHVAFAHNHAIGEAIRTGLMEGSLDAAQCADLMVEPPETDTSVPNYVDPVYDIFAITTATCLVALGTYYYMTRIRR